MINDNAQSTATENLSEVTQSTPSTHSAPPAEKMLPQSEVNRIAAERYNAGMEKAKRESTNTQPAAATPDPEQFKAMYAELRAEERKQEEAHRLQMQAQGALKAVEDVKAQLLPAMKTDGEAKYEDFSSVTAKLPLNNPGLLWALKSVDNPSDLAYEFAKDPVRKKVVMDLINSESSDEFEEGVGMLKQLAQSIKNNESVKSRGIPNAPLSTVKPSGNGADNGVKTVADLMKVYRA